MDTLFRKTHSTDRKQSVPDSNAYLCVAQELCKDNANREQRHQTRLNGYAEMPLIFCKDSERREQRHTGNERFTIGLCRTASYLLQR